MDTQLEDQPRPPCPPGVKAKTKQDEYDEWYGQESAKAGKPPAGLQWEEDGLDKDRRVAEQFAATIVQRMDEGGKRPSDSEVLACLRLWAFRKNSWRTNVIPAGETYVLSDTLGAVRRLTGGETRATDATKRHPQWFAS